MARVRRGALILCLNRPIYFSKSPWFKFHFNIYIARNNDNPCLVFLLRVGLRAGGKGFFFFKALYSPTPPPKSKWYVIVCWLDFCVFISFKRHILFGKFLFWFVLFSLDLKFSNIKYCSSSRSFTLYPQLPKWPRKQRHSYRPVPSSCHW